MGIGEHLPNLSRICKVALEKPPRSPGSSGGAWRCYRRGRTRARYVKAYDGITIPQERVTNGRTQAAGRPCDKHPLHRVGHGSNPLALKIPSMADTEFIF